MKILSLKLLTGSFCAFLIVISFNSYAETRGPVYPAPGGNDWTGSGSGTGGYAIWSYSNFDTSAFDSLYFGLNQIDYGPAGAGLNNIANTFSLYGFSGQTAEWRADTTWLNPITSSEQSATVRLLMTITGLGATPWITDLTSIGLDNSGKFADDIGAVVDNSNGVDFVLQWSIQADVGNGWEAIDSITQDPSHDGYTQSSFATGFYYISRDKDFNADGSPDLLLRNYSHGQNQIWFLDNATKIGQASLPTIPDIHWKFEGMADFNDDGNPDLLLRNHSHGANQIWFMDGVSKIGQVSLPTIPDTNWHFEGAADFNGDKKPDIILRNHSHGANQIWYMDGATKIWQLSLPTIPDINWYFEGVADFNGDNKPDLLLRNHNHGANQIWYMDDVSKTGSVNLPTIPDTFWVFQGAADFDGDMKPDLLMRNYSHGANQIWYMDGASKIGQVGLPRIPDTNWRIENR